MAERRFICDSGTVCIGERICRILLRGSCWNRGKVSVPKYRPHVRNSGGARAWGRALA